MLEKKQRVFGISAFGSATNGWGRCGEVWGGARFADTLSFTEHYHLVYLYVSIRTSREDDQ